MEPLDPVKNAESSGFSRRRISSILKAPRKSTIFPDPEQQENVVECPKPVEKRNSRRVSFAPANDVLLFSKDVKNASPARSPLQEMITTATQNRVQVAVFDDGNQQITGMETLLNAPLHASQQSDKVNFDTGFGEKTVMFSPDDDALMDMTHCHTINIANDSELHADISFQSGVLPTGREKTMFTVDDGFKGMTLSRTLNPTGGSLSLPAGRNMDLSVGKISSSVPCLDPEFENFLASLSKPSGPGVNPVIARATPPAGPSSEETNLPLPQIKTRRATVDKENQVPASVSAVMEKSLTTSRRIGDSSYGSALCPKDDDDDAFQCLFPTKEMYSQAEEKTKQQQSSKKPASFNPKDTTFSKNPPQRASHQRQKVNLDTKDDCREKTITFSAGDEFMDMTQSHTVNIASGSLAFSNQTASSLEERKREISGPPGSSASALDDGFDNFLASLSKTSAPKGNPAIATMVPPTAASTKSFGESFHGGDENDVDMDMTEAQTGRIVRPAGSDDAFQFRFPTKGKSTEKTSGQQHKEALGSSNRKGMETSLKPPLTTKVQRHQVKYDDEDDGREKTVRFNADDAAMDVTRSHTVNIATNLELQSHQNVDFTPACGEKTVRFSANDAAMDVTRSHTVNIATAFELQSHQNLDLSPTCGEKTMRFTANDAAMDMTQCLTVNIASNLVSDSVPSVKKQSGLPGNKSSAHGLDPRFNNTLTSLSNPTGPGVSRVTPTAAQSSNTGDASVCPEDDVSMDMTEVGHMLGGDISMDITESQLGHVLGSDDLLQCLFPTQDPQSGNLKKAAMISQQQHVGAPGSSNRKGMETSRAASVKTKVQRPQVKFDAEDDCREKTVRFSADDAAMDVTRSHTVNIATNLELQSHQNVDFTPACGEKTVRFSANDAAMDVTRSHTVNIATAFEAQSHQKGDFLPAYGEKTVRFPANDAAMDMTQSHTVNIATDFEPQLPKNGDVLPTCGEKTVRFPENDAAMDMTHSQTVNIASNSMLDSVLPTRDSNIFSTHENMDFPLSVRSRKSETSRPRRSRPSSARALDPGFTNPLFKTSGLGANPVITEAVIPAEPSPQEAADTNGLLDELKTQTPGVETEKEAPGFVSAVMENPLNKTTTDCPENDVSMDMTEAQTGRILGQTCTDEPPQCPPSTHDLKETEVTSQQRYETPGSPNADGVETTNRPDSLDSNESDTRKEPEPRNQTVAVEHDVDAAPSRKSRRMSLADLHSKVRRLSHMINTAPDTIAMDSCTAPLSQLEHDMDENAKDKTKSLPAAAEPELRMGLGSTEENTQAHCLVQGEEPSTTTTPFKLKTKQLMSRLSVGGFKPKLPRRNTPKDPKKEDSVGEHTKTVTVSVTNKLSNFDGDVSDINDEELGSLEDMSEALDARSPRKDTEKKMDPSSEFNMDEHVEDGLFEEDFISAVHGTKRPLQVDENNVGDEKRIRASTETATDFEAGVQPHVEECDGNITAAPSTTTHSTDYSNSSHTATIRCEATFESTSKHSMFESQLEGYANDAQRKLDDGTITVLEFFKLFNIDFVIHNPRHSVLPGRLLSDTDRTAMDLLKDRHITRPKQTVYEADVLNLTEKVEGLKQRMQDLDKPLRIVNRPLWEEVRNFSEKELKSFGAKLKERNNLFRKTSKAQSHEMKEVLYSNLVQANLEEQQRLRGTINGADEMIKSLDDCIGELQTELAAVEEKGFKDTPSLKSRQEEMQKVSEASTADERRISKLEMKKVQISKNLNRLKAQTKNLKTHLNLLHLVNEWKLREKRDDCMLYTFLHKTFHLQLVFEKSKGNDAADQSERKISHISFKHLLDAEKSWDHACLVHKLLAQYIEGEASWVDKYPTSRHVPKLLHDVGLVVSRCRLLGEELRLLKMWGSLRLDILSISCVDTQVHIVFSSLKTMSKFEVIFSVSLTHQLCVLQVQSFKNVFGSTTIQQIEEIVASFSPEKNVLTKIVKKIHENLLR